MYIVCNREKLILTCDGDTGLGVRRVGVNGNCANALTVKIM
jgi:hypothetical protein